MDAFRPSGFRKRSPISVDRHIGGRRKPVQSFPTEMRPTHALEFSISKLSLS